MYLYIIFSFCCFFLILKFVIFQMNDVDEYVLFDYGFVVGDFEVRYQLVEFLKIQYNDNVER